jgi:NADPH:quinone reductase-like Zn-dependent oxidoreductase
MKAIVYTQTGSPDVLHLKEIETPIPEDNQLLIKVHAASVNALDWHAIRNMPVLLSLLGRLLGGGGRAPKEKRLGADLAGRVEAVGSKVTEFKVGDEVFGQGSGTFADYACARESFVTLKPADLSFEAAAAVPVAAITALQGLRDIGQIQPGQQVVIQGAGGGVGTFAVQIAKCLGAEVTAVYNPKNVDLVRSLGADHIIDYTQEDFTKQRQRYDLILAVNGYHPLSAYRRALRPKGRFVLVGASSDHLLQAVFQTMILGPMTSRMSSKKTKFFVANVNQKDLEFVRGLIEAGKVTPIIDRQYPLSKTAEALRFMGEGHVRGKIVITMDESDTNSRIIPA